MSGIIDTPEKEQRLMTELWSPAIKDDPEAFVMYAYPWGKSGTPLEAHKRPRTWQRKLLRRLADNIKSNIDATDTYEMIKEAIVSGRGIGKTTTIGWLIDWMVSTRIGSTVIVSANSEDQLKKSIFSELAKWVTMSINAHWWDITSTSMKPHKWLADLVERDLNKGTRHWGAEGKLWSEENPHSYVGNHNMDGMMVIFDEASGIPDAIWSAAAGFFTENIPNRYWYAFSNGRRNSGYFFEAVEGSKRDFWHSEKIDAREVEGVDKAIYQDIISEYGEDSDEARVEVYGDFPVVDESEAFISRVLVVEAMKRPAWDDPTAPRIMGVDPCGGGPDTMTILTRQGRDVIETRRFRWVDPMAAVGHIIDAMREMTPMITGVDEGNVGYAIIDRLLEQGFKVRGVNFGSRSSKPKVSGNKRADMYMDMRDWLRTASIPYDRHLLAELTGIRKKPNSSGVMYLESKREMKARGLPSPDMADALAITFAFDVGVNLKRKNKEVVTPLLGGELSWMGS